MLSVTKSLNAHTERIKSWTLERWLISTRVSKDTVLYKLHAGLFNSLSFLSATIKPLTKKDKIFQMNDRETVIARLLEQLASNKVILTRTPLCLHLQGGREREGKESEREEASLTKRCSSRLLNEARTLGLWDSQTCINTVANCGVQL